MDALTAVKNVVDALDSAEFFVPFFDEEGYETIFVWYGGSYIHTICPLTGEETSVFGFGGQELKPTKDEAIAAYNSCLANLKEEIAADKAANE